MTRSETLTEEDLLAVTNDVDIGNVDSEVIRRAKERVATDEDSACASGVLFTPTFFINGITLTDYSADGLRAAIDKAVAGNKWRRIAAITIANAHDGRLEKFLSPSLRESDSVTARGDRQMERACHGSEGLFRC